MRTIMLLKDGQNKMYMKVTKSALLVLMVFMGLNDLARTHIFPNFTFLFTLNPALTGLSFNKSCFITNYRYEFGYQNFETYENSFRCDDSYSQAHFWCGCSGFTGLF